MRGIAIVSIVFLLLAAHSVKAKVFDKIVDVNGNGDYTTIQEALNAVPDNSSSRTLIFVKNGTYTEKVKVELTKTNVSLIGESVGGVIITWDDYAGKDGLSSANTYTFWCDAKNFYAENITFQNTSGNVGQALAIRTTGDYGVYKNCRFLGFQDTYYAHKNRQYNYQCYVEGGTDFVYGDAIAVYDYCTINCVRGGSYISAPSDSKLITKANGEKIYHGLMFDHCTVTCNSDVAAGSYYMGRPWQPDGSSVFLNSKLGGHINPAGWAIWSGTNNHLSGSYAEYNNTDLNGNALDLSARADWSKQLTGEEYSNYYNLDYFFAKSKTDTWNPSETVQTLKTPENVVINGNAIQWDAVDGAVGYVVFSGDSLLGISESTTLDITGNVTDVTVHSVRETGALSTPSNENVLGTNDLIFPESDLQLTILNGVVSSNREVCFQVFNINGQLLKDVRLATYLPVGEFGRGVFIIKAIDSKGRNRILKIRK